MPGLGAGFLECFDCGGLNEKPEVGEGGTGSSPSTSPAASVGSLTQFRVWGLERAQTRIRR